MVGEGWSDGGVEWWKRDGVMGCGVVGEGWSDGVWSGGRGME